LVPKERKFEPDGIKAMTDEQLDAAIGALQDLLARRAAAAKLDASPALPAPDVIDVKPVKPKDDSTRYKRRELNKPTKISVL
jgi:hypothetical protein